MGKCKYYLLHLGIVPYHKISYTPDLGIALFSGLLRGLLSAWYFDGDAGARLEITKLIPSARFVNFHS